MGLNSFITVRKCSLRRLCFYRCVSTRGGGVEGSAIPACIAGGIPACIAGFQAYTQRGSLGGSGWGEGVSRSTAKGKLRGSGPGPHPRRKFRGIWLGGCLLPGGCLWGCLLWGGGGDPLVTATAAGGTHPTGMHSCLIMCLHLVDINLYLLMGSSDGKTCCHLPYLRVDKDSS